MMQTTPRFFRSKSWMPLFSLFLGGLILAAMWVGGNPREGVFGFALLAAVGALFFFGKRSETLQGLGGPGRDERWAMIDIHATALSGLVTLVVLIGAWLWELAHGRDGGPYGQIMAVAGLAYIVSVVFLRWRS